MNPRPLFISTFCCIDYPLPEGLRILSERTTHVEILADGLHDLLDDPSVCSEFPFTYTVHAPTSEINSAAVSERVRSTSIAVISDVLDVCKRIGAAHLVVHPGYAAYDQVKERSSASLLRSLDELAKLQEEHGVRVCMENMGAWECCHFRTPAFIPELTARGLGITLDCGHARLNGNLDAFLAVGGFCHVHLHDNHGTNDDHAACGSGAVDFSRVIRQVPKNANLVVETRELAAADESISHISPLLMEKRP